MAVICTKTMKIRKMKTMTMKKKMMMMKALIREDRTAEIKIAKKDMAIMEEDNTTEIRDQK